MLLKNQRTTSHQARKLSLSIPREKLAVIENPAERKAPGFEPDALSDGKLVNVFRRLSTDY
jgi:hypothetical protein